MKKVLSVFMLTLTTLAISPTSFAAREGICKITEPKGGPLNVRATPDGRIVSKLKNGRKVVTGDIDYDNAGQPWIKVYDANSGRYLGWVFREFITCY